MISLSSRATRSYKESLPARVSEPRIPEIHRIYLFGPADRLPKLDFDAGRCASAHNG